MLSQPSVCKGGQKVPEPGEFERRPPAPQGGGGAAIKFPSVELVDAIAALSRVVRSSSVSVNEAARNIDAVRLLGKGNLKPIH